MGNRKFLFSVVIVTLVLVLGVGYAVVSSVYLNIGGVANVNNSDLNIEITDVTASSSIVDKTLDFNNIITEKINSEFTLNGMDLDEIVTITYTIINNEKDIDAALTLKEGVMLSNSNSDYFEVDYEIKDNKTDLVNNDKIMTVVLTVKLIKVPIDVEDNSTEVGVSFTATPSETE